MKVFLIYVKSIYLSVYKIILFTSVYTGLFKMDDGFCDTHIGGKTQGLAN
jgi:hypothetical protein